MLPYLLTNHSPGAPTIVPVAETSPRADFSRARATAAVIPGASAATQPRSTAAQKAAPLPAAWEPPIASRAWRSIVLHHSATARGDVPSIDAAHRRLKDRNGQPWLGIAYHFVIGNGQGMVDGEVQPTFRWQQQLQGAHAGDHLHNEYGIGICLIGNFNDARPTARQMAAVKKLVKALANRYAIGHNQVVRHLDIHATQCPGRLFPFAEVLAALTQGVSDGKSAFTPHARYPVYRAG
jgi:hypothetical protein